MAVTVAVPAEAMRGRHSFGDDHFGADREAPDRGPVQNQIAEMAVLLGNTRGSTILGGSVLSALTIGIAIEAMFSPSVLRPGLAGAVTVSLLGCVILCWLRAAALLLLASPPDLDELNDHRWRTGAPLDPRVRWLSTPSIEDGQANLVLGAGRHSCSARPASGGSGSSSRKPGLSSPSRASCSGPRRSSWGREETGLAGLLAATGRPVRLPAPASPALPGPPSSVPPMAQRAGKTRVLPRRLSTVPEWLIVEPGSAPTRWPAAGLPR